MPELLPLFFKLSSLLFLCQSQRLIDLLLGHLIVPVLLLSHFLSEAIFKKPTYSLLLQILHLAALFIVHVHNLEISTNEPVMVQPLKTPHLILGALQVILVKNITFEVQHVPCVIIGFHFKLVLEELLVLLQQIHHPLGDVNLSSVHMVLLPPSRILIVSFHSKLCPILVKSYSH